MREFNFKVFACALICLLLVSLSGYSQITSFTTSVGTDPDLAASNLSGYFVTPYYGSTEPDHDQGYLMVSNQDANSNDYQGIRLTAVDRSGTPMWSNLIRNNDPDNGNDDSIRVFGITYDDRDDSYILTGYSMGNNNFYQLLLLKVDNLGNKIWMQSWHSASAPCVADPSNGIPNPRLFGLSIAKVVHDPNASGNISDFVVTGYLAEVTQEVQLFTAVKRPFIWRVSIPTTGTPPVLVTRYFKTFHGAYYNGSPKITNYEASLNVQEVYGKGFMVTGTTKDTTNVWGTNWSLIYFNTKTSSRWRFFYGLIPYNGGTANTGPATFTYAFYDDFDWSRKSAVRLFSDYGANTGYLLLNNTDRAWFEVLPINLTTGVPTMTGAGGAPSGYFFHVPHGDTMPGFIGTNIIEKDAGRLTVMGYSYNRDLVSHIYPFTIDFAKDGSSSSQYYCNRISSGPYLNYSPMASPLDFHKTNALCSTVDTFQSVVTPINGIANDFISEPDVVVTSPHYISQNTLIEQALTLFTNRTDVDCHPRYYNTETIEMLYNLQDYRAIALVDDVDLEDPQVYSPIDVPFLTYITCPDISAYKLNSPNLKKENELTISPNPTSNAISFNHQNWEFGTLTDITGKEILRTPKISNIDMTNLSSGIYILDIYFTDKSKQSFKIVKR